jgi:hypothetical protein
LARSDQPDIVKIFLGAIHGAPMQSPIIRKLKGLVVGLLHFILDPTLAAFEKSVPLHELP